MRPTAAVTKAIQHEKFEVDCEGLCIMALILCKVAPQLRRCTNYVRRLQLDLHFRCRPVYQFHRQAVGRFFDVSKHMDLEYFLDAAHGDQFNHRTMKNRDAATRKTNLPKTSPDVPHMNFEHAHVTVTFVLVVRSCASSRSVEASIQRWQRMQASWPTSPYQI